MLSVKDLFGHEEPFTAFKGLRRTRKVNAEKQIELTVYPAGDNQDYYNMIEEESSIHALSDDYIIKQLKERSKGKKTTKQITGIHKFYVDLINKQQPRIHNGSITFRNYMQMVFEDLPYDFVIVDQFNAREFQNLGNTNRLDLLQKGLERFKAEMELVGNTVYFYKQVGNDTDFQFRFGHNIKAIERDISTTNLTTVIRGTGDPELEVEAYYRSPNADIFGEIDAPPVEDERFKSEEALLEEMESRLVDTPEVTITVDFVDLRAAGYPYAVPNEGDRIWLIYEPMDDLMMEVRILEIDELFKYNEETGEFIPTKTEVTLSNKKKTFAGTMFNNVRKQLNDIVDGDGVIRYNVLDEAVKIATEALHSAQTELEFNNGIIAREKDDPNKIVLFNSAGIGISDDGGQNFQTAMTGEGIVADVITAGTLRGINIIGTTIISFNTETNDTVTIEDGTIETQVRGLRRFALRDNGLIAYHWETEEMVATFRASHRSNEYFGAGIIGYGDYFSIGRHIGGGTSRPQLNFDWNREYDTAYLYGGSGERNSGELELRANNYGSDMAGVRAPVIYLSRYDSDSGTDWSGITIYTGRDDKSPSSSNFRSGFEIWQYQGDGNSDLMFRIDTNTDDVKYIDAFVDALWVEGEARSSDRFLLGGDAAHGVNHGFILRPYGDGYEHIITSRNNEGELTIYPQRWSGRDRFRIRSHNGRSDYSNDFRISNGGHVLADWSLKTRRLFLTNGSPGDSNTNDRVWFDYDSLNFTVNTKDSSGTWFKRLEVEGRGVDGAENNTTHIWDRIRSEGTRYNIVTWGARVAMSDSGYMGFVSSSERYKLAIEDIDVDPYLIHKLSVKSWYDKFNTEKYADLLTRKENGEDVSLDVENIKRIPGLIAEDVHAAGLTLFVNYDKEGKPEGIDDTRLWMLLIPISSDHENRLNEYDKRFGTVEKRIDKLEDEVKRLKGVA